MSSANLMWLNLLADVMGKGIEVAPRGKLTKELAQKTVIVSMQRPVITVDERRLSYQFMAAEAFWILSGDDSVAGLAPYNKRIVEFSDDGERFFGAYGPRIIDQLPFVVSKLLEDISTRQAVLTTWRQKPPKSKDVPCTVAMAFNVRGGWLNCHVFMRSSDVWLGIPYDVFSFSMVAHLVCARYNSQQGNARALRPGHLYVTAASSHLYEENWEAAKKLALEGQGEDTDEVPSWMWQDEKLLLDQLKALRETKRGDALRWWEKTL